MALYRCAMCGSSKIVPETKKEGYNKKKGIWGAALFGGIGALAGTSGNTVTYYHCADCGAVLNRTMLPYEKESIERCLASPDIFEDSLKSYKERYRNIEWEEKQTISKTDNLTVSDFEDRIIGYMEKKGRPVRFTELNEKKLGITSVEVYELSVEEGVLIEEKMRSAIQNLRERGMIKNETIGDDVFCVLVTDIEEMKELALKQSAGKKARVLVRENDYTTIIMKMLSTHGFMSWEEIYDYLKQNNLLTEDVIRAEKENVFFSQYFTVFCIKKLRIIDGHGSDIVYFDPYVCENGRYRLKTTEEVEQEELDTLKLIISTLKRAKEAISILKMTDVNKECKKSLSLQKRYLEQLEKIGIVKIERRRNGGTPYYSLIDVSQEEIDKILYDAISSKKIGVFLQKFL